jgi:hypothetical protein
MVNVEQLGDHTGGIKRAKSYPEVLASAALVLCGCTSWQEHEFTMGVATLASSASGQSSSRNVHATGTLM